jgi:MFS family permease
VTRVGIRVTRAVLAIVALLATGVTLVALAFVPDAFRLLSLGRVATQLSGAGFSLLLGLELGILLIPAVTYLMEHTPERVRGRIFSMLFLVVNGVTALPILAGAALSDLFGIGRVIGGLGVILVLAALALAGPASRALAEEAA